MVCGTAHPNLLVDLFFKVLFPESQLKFHKPEFLGAAPGTCHLAHPPKDFWHKLGPGITTVNHHLEVQPQQMSRRETGQVWGVNPVPHLFLIYLVKDMLLV